MPHELDSRADGTASVFSFRQTPWHKEGTILNTAPSLEEALRLGGLDFDVDVRPLFVRSQPDSDLSLTAYCPAGNAAATVRTDRGTVLGIVTDRYQALQN